MQKKYNTCPLKRDAVRSVTVREFNNRITDVFCPLLPLFARRWMIVIARYNCTMYILSEYYSYTSSFQTNNSRHSPSRSNTWFRTNIHPILRSTISPFPFLNICFMFDVFLSKV